jgi:monovalent cation/hydrogen antiporter
MSGTIQLLILLLVVVAGVALAARRLKMPPAILLVLVGTALALIPGLPAMELAPEVVLLLVLPPVIYWSAVAMSWREFRFNLRPISLLAIGCVAFSTLAVAAATHWLLRLPWPIGFVLGAIVSPPDPVAPLSIARRMQIPRRILVVLEGEGLANDATALILYRFAVVAVSLGYFSLGKALGMFAVIVVGEIFWGIGVGWGMLRLRRWVHDPRVEITLSILTPFLAYWPPQYLGGSGVLATVTVGLYVSWNGPRLISAATRLQGIFLGDFIMYLAEGLIFLITGLQARALTAGIRGLSLSELALSAIVVSVVLIAARFMWTYPTVYLPRWFFPPIRRADPSPPWQWPFAIAFTGVRGIVSLAAALALPLTTASGQPFPERDLILFITFAVILVTLVVQGLMLPSIIRALGLAHYGRRERDQDRKEEYRARLNAIEAAIDRLDEFAGKHKLPDDFIKPIQAAQRIRLRNLQNTSDGDEAHRKLTVLHDEIEMLLISTERQRVNELYRAGDLKDEARRRIERELDLREAHLANRRDDG